MVSSASRCLFASVLLLGCSSESGGGGTPSCGGVGTLEVSAGPQHGVARIDDVVMSGSAFSVLVTECSGDMHASLFDIPAAVGEHSLVEMSPAGFGASIFVIQGNDGYTIGVDKVVGCTPCGSGTVTVDTNDGSTVSGTFKGTGWQLAGQFNSNPNATLTVSGKFSGKVK